MASDKVLTLKASDLTPEGLSKLGTVLVDFWAPWCGPCRMVGPIVEQLAEDFDGRLKVGKLNVDDEGEAAMKYGVSSIPTLIVFKAGSEVERVVGARNKSALTELLNKHC